MPRHMDDLTYAVAEAIARNQWEIRCEEEQSKTDFEVLTIDFDDLGSHRDYLIGQMRTAARAAIKAVREHAS